MKPQRTRSNSLGTQKEFPLTDEFQCGTAKGVYKKVHRFERAQRGERIGVVKLIDSRKYLCELCG
jgi:hypothetical protein